LMNCGTLTSMPLASFAGLNALSAC
jgi:hypothetical protein